ncbi:MAG: 2OG-Fe(II) oxygenase [Microcoleaceae cyanobacterium]
MTHASNLVSQNLTTPDGTALDLKQRFNSLVNQSFEALESILEDHSLSAQERAAIALKVLEVAGASPSTSSTSLPVQSFTRETPQSALPAIYPRQPSLKSAPYSQQSVIQTEAVHLPGEHVQIDDFLSPEENEEILQIALGQSEKFVASQTTTQAENYRQSSILYATLFPEFYELMRQRILKALPTTLEQLKLPSFEVAQVEMQLTAHNDGCFYKIHNDSGSAQTVTRVLTYVYYFNKRPQKFSGGELRLYETEIKAGAAIAEGQFKTIEPRNNRIVFFDSRCKHEVMPVKCPSRKFDHGRFTLNGWLRRTDKNG